MRHWWHSLRVRRFVPWALLGLVAALAGLAAAVGATSAPRAPSVLPTAWVANLLATTARAGTAHFSYSSVSASRSAFFAGSTSGISIKLTCRS
jgi:CHASE1-domain containing sensor protein